MATTTHQTTSSSRRRTVIQSFTSPRDRLPYLWLALAIVLLPFGTLRWTILLAAWLVPIFLLRFLRTQPLLRGILGSVSFAKGEEKRRKEEDTIELKHSQVVE